MEQVPSRAATADARRAFSSEPVRRASAPGRAGGSGWLPTERVEENRQQRVHAAKHGTRGYETSMKTARQKLVEDRRPACDDVHRHAPRRALAADGGCRLMIANDHPDD